MFFKKTEIKVNLPKLLDHYNHNYSSQSTRRISINSRTESYDPADLCAQLVYTEYPIILPEFKGTVWEETLNLIPGKKSRARIHTVSPFSVLEAHRDFEKRYHVALVTDEACKIVDLENNMLYHIPADGYVYEIDTTVLHTFINTSNNCFRTHLVVCQYV